MKPNDPDRTEHLATTAPASWLRVHRTTIPDTIAARAAAVRNDDALTDALRRELTAWPNPMGRLLVLAGATRKKPSVPAITVALSILMDRDPTSFWDVWWPVAGASRKSLAPMRSVLSVVPPETLGRWLTSAPETVTTISTPVAEWWVACARRAGWDEDRIQAWGDAHLDNPEVWAIALGRGDATGNAMVKEARYPGRTRRPLEDWVPGTPLAMRRRAASAALGNTDTARVPSALARRLPTADHVRIATEAAAVNPWGALDLCPRLPLGALLPMLTQHHANRRTSAHVQIIDTGIAMTLMAAMGHRALGRWHTQRAVKAATQAYLRRARHGAQRRMPAPSPPPSPWTREEWAHLLLWPPQDLPSPALRARADAAVARWSDITDPAVASIIGAICPWSPHLERGWQAAADASWQRARGIDRVIRDDMVRHPVVEFAAKVAPRLAAAADQLYPLWKGLGGDGCPSSVESNSIDSTEALAIARMALVQATVIARLCGARSGPPWSPELRRRRQALACMTAALNRDPPSPDWYASPVVQAAWSTTREQMRSAGDAMADTDHDPWGTMGAWVRWTATLARHAPPSVAPFWRAMGFQDTLPDRPQETPSITAVYKIWEIVRTDPSGARLCHAVRAGNAELTQELLSRSPPRHHVFAAARNAFNRYGAEPETFALVAKACADPRDRDHLALLAATHGAWGLALAVWPDADPAALADLAQLGAQAVLWKTPLPPWCQIGQPGDPVRAPLPPAIHEWVRTHRPDMVDAWPPPLPIQVQTQKPRRRKS